MRIGLLIYGSLDTLTGGYLYNRLVVEEWRRMGDEVVIISLPYRSYWRHLSDNFSLRLARRLRGARIDVLVQDELNHPSLFLMNRWLRSQIHYPIVSIVHLLRSSEQRPAYQNLVYRFIEAAYLRNVDGHIVNSLDTQRLVRELIDRHVPGIVAYPGRDHLIPSPTRKPPASPDASDLRLITVGNVVPRKGLQTLLAALAQSHLERWTLQVIGSLEMDPSYVSAIRRQLQDLGLQDRVRLLGQVPNHEVADYLAQADLFVLVSQYEAFGIVYLEALATGLPLVASTAGAAKEIVRHNQEGWLVPPNDPQQLAHTLDTIGRQPDLLRSAGQRARERYLVFPTWAETARTIRDFLSAVRIRQ